MTNFSEANRQDSLPLPNCENTALPDNEKGGDIVGVVGLRGLPDVMGGIESHCEELYPKLAKSLNERIMIAVRAPYATRENGPYDGMWLKSIYTIRHKLFETILHTFLSIIYFRKIGAKAVHIHAVGPGLLVPFARLIGLRTIFTHHGRDYDRAKWSPIAKFMLRRGEAIAVRFANESIVVADGVANSLRKRFPGKADNIHFVPNGASLKFQEGSPDPDSEILEQFNLKQGEYVLAVGRLVPEKGFHDLIEAFEKSGITHKLVIAGAADHADSYASSLLAKASDRVIFTGFQTHATLRSLYLGASLFVLPSYHEGLPIAALEAIAVGQAPLLSDIEANKEIGLNDRNYYKVGDVVDLAEKLQRPHSEYAVDHKAISARFDWKRIAEQTFAIYRRVLRD